MLKEFRGHGSYIHSCQYHYEYNDDDDNDDDHQRHSNSNKRRRRVLQKGDDDSPSVVVLVVSGSGDGTVRIWHGTTSEVLRVLQPPLPGANVSISSSSLIMGNATAMRGAGIDDVSMDAGMHPPICNVLIVPHDATSSRPVMDLILVPRGLRAYRVNFQGTVQQIYKVESEQQIMVAATVSESWLYVATEDGNCVVFDIESGEIETTITDFALDTTTTSSKRSGSGKVAEITGLCHHPSKSILAAFSNDKTVKRGLVTLWK